MSGERGAWNRAGESRIRFRAAPQSVYCEVMNMTRTHRRRLRTARKTTWRERVFVLGGLGAAFGATAILLVLGTATHLIGPLWFAAIVWTVVAAIANVLWLGFRHGDWSAFRRYEPHDDGGDLLDWSTRTGRYAYMRDQHDRHRHDDDYIRNHDRHPSDHGAAFLAEP